MRERGCVPRQVFVPTAAAAAAGTEQHTPSAHANLGRAATSAPSSDQSQLLVPHGAQSQPGLEEQQRQQQQPWGGFTLADALAVHECKSFDYRVSGVGGDGKDNSTHDAAL